MARGLFRHLRSEGKVANFGLPAASLRRSTNGNLFKCFSSVNNVPHNAKNEEELPTAATWREKLQLYSELSKASLTSVVVMTTGAGFLLAGHPIDWGTCAAAVVGTSLASAAASTFNQVYEIETDKKMMRTQNRPLPAGRISKGGAIAFGTSMAVMSTGILAAWTNPITTALGVGNIILYSWIYTPLKRYTELNTAIGAIVGAIPPVMGWAAATGSLMCLDPYLLAYTLFAWQFPHFYSLSWRLRHDYARGGHQMVPCSDPTGERTAKLSMRHSLGLFLVPFVSTAIGMTSPMFLVEGLFINGYLLYLAQRFRANRTNGTATPLFRYSLVYIVALMALMVFHAQHWKEFEGKRSSLHSPHVAAFGDEEEEKKEHTRGITVGEGIEHAIACGRLLGKKICAHEMIANALPTWLIPEDSPEAKEVGPVFEQVHGVSDAQQPTFCPVSALKTGKNIYCPVVTLDNPIKKVPTELSDDSVAQMSACPPLSSLDSKV